MAKPQFNKGLKPKDTEQLACALAGSLTRHEVLFLRRLSLANIVSFDFQVRIGYYVADFVFPGKMLIIEVDGKSHERRREHDARRDAFLAQAGFTVWRIANKDAQRWPLNLITAHERPSTGRGYIDALRWAHGRHERGMREKGKRIKPRPPEEAKEDFYKRLMQVTERHQQAERDRRARYAEERDLRAAMGVRVVWPDSE